MRLLILAATTLLGCYTSSLSAVESGRAASLWSHDNLLAWCVIPFDAQKRGPEERAQMLERLGFRYLAYDGDTNDIEAEIVALRRHQIKFVAWYFPDDRPDLTAKQAEAVFKLFAKYGLHPQLWVTESMFNAPFIENQWDHWTAPFSGGQRIPRTVEGWTILPANGQSEILARFMRADRVHTLTEQRQRVQLEAQRISNLARLAAPYGIKVELYNHNGWYGMVDNEVAIITRLKELGINDVGIVYNFSHAHDKLHDDTIDFKSLWEKIQPYVVTVNITGMSPIVQIIYLSQGNHELAMMRTIQESEWQGPIGLIAENGGDAETVLKNNLIGLDWLAAEIQQPGSAGPRPLVR